MASNKSYIGISFIILVFGILVIPKIVERVKNGDIVKADRLNMVEGSGGKASGLFTKGKAPDFILTDQNGQTITNNDYKGKVYALEFFFTTCPTICPKMNANMLKLQDAFAGNKNFGLASITINPDNDTPKVLKEHADLIGVTSANWHMMTGKRDYIFDLANKGFNVFAGTLPDNSNGGFEHSGLFALIDKNGYIRSRRDDSGNPIVYYDGLSPQGIAQLKEDIKILLEE
ncbi:SCO family protein [Flavobacterium magnum]|uniref:SCO family protein n=1 Tax=Flavobacterium magnum TaxID=2162713 RepID=A0A2S0RCZ2_9FLAO|nr:SCO family protein [Flavobacterium magnum]AWA29546.1 SCO family protein [Flavobacterium magnum]